MTAIFKLPLEIWLRMLSFNRCVFKALLCIRPLRPIAHGILYRDLKICRYEVFSEMLALLSEYPSLCDFIKSISIDLEGQVPDFKHLEAVLENCTLIREITINKDKNGLYDHIPWDSIASRISFSSLQMLSGSSKPPAMIDILDKVPFAALERLVLNPDGKHPYKLSEANAQKILHFTLINDGGNQFCPEIINWCARLTNVQTLVFRATENAKYF